MIKIGILTIGQSPRDDVTPTMKRIFGEEIKVIERGGLDRFTEDQLHIIAPKSSEPTYISRLRNGKSIKISKKKLLPLLQQELHQLEKEVDVTIMLCTGDFPTLKTKKPIIFPDKVLTHMIKAIHSNGKLGLIIPLSEQKKSLNEKWNNLKEKIEVGVASPYADDDIEQEAKKLTENGVNMIVLDCMGYNEQHKKRAQSTSNIPVILPRTLVAHIAKEYV